MDSASIKTLKADGLRITKPRRAILALLEGAPSPLTAGQVHARLARSQQSVDLVTVYRTLTTLKRLGLVAQVELGDGQFYYEIRHGRAHHHHIRCRGCGEIVDLVLCPLKRLKALIERKTRFVVESHALEFIGLCARCR
jgi:Fe2+ or Zn2+ uptake regulation protein